MRSGSQKSDRSDIPALIAELKNDDGLVREKARLILVGMGEAAVAPLMQVLTGKNRGTRWEAAKALGEIASPVAAPALVKALEDEDGDVRWLAAEALIAIGRGGVAPLLEALVAHSGEYLLRQGAHHVLHHLSGSDAGIAHHEMKHPRSVDPAIQQMLKPVVSAIEDMAPSPRVPMMAQAALDGLRRLSAAH
jgi:HEAT repeat protein